ncbi:MAG: hypothetical protein SFU25_02915 [Candidatus Caenarcaniphilales bacterium]|nr:hypothetical protein [Candidatus Caenarcaniphilales bacterium]
MSYSLPRKVFLSFEELLGKEKAEIVATELETSLRETIIESKETLKNELKNELVTRELFEKETFSIRESFQKEGEYTRKLFEERFKLQDLKLNIVIAIAALALTLFNPALLGFLEKVFRL